MLKDKACCVQSTVHWMKSIWKLVQWKCTWTSPQFEGPNDQLEQCTDAQRIHWSKWPAPIGHCAQVAWFHLMTISSVSGGAKILIWINTDVQRECGDFCATHFSLWQQVTTVWNKCDTEAKRIWVFHKPSYNLPWFLCHIGNAVQPRPRKHDSTWCFCSDTVWPLHQV